MTSGFKAASYIFQRIIKVVNHDRVEPYFIEGASTGIWKRPQCFLNAFYIRFDVLTAVGCGASGETPPHVSEIFRKIKCREAVGPVAFLLRLSISSCEASQNF